MKKTFLIFASLFTTKALATSYTTGPECEVRATFQEPTLVIHNPNPLLDSAELITLKKVSHQCAERWSAGLYTCSTLYRQTDATTLPTYEVTLINSIPLAPAAVVSETNTGDEEEDHGILSIFYSGRQTQCFLTALPSSTTNLQKPDDLNPSNAGSIGH